MDFSEALKIPISKSHAPLAGGGVVNGAAGTGSGHSVGGTDQGAGYVTEKLYMLLQLYLQNKGWNPSVELLQCFAELKDTPILPSAAYLQALASRVALDNQGRLVLRETGKIVLPYEHFANAVMLKHMSGPHGLHLSIEATVRAVMDSYTIGRDSFGMEKEFIVEVVQSCPSPACRYYKGQLGVGSFIDQPSFGASGSSSAGTGGPPGGPGGHLNSAEYLTHLQQQLGQQNAGLFELGANERDPSKALLGQVKHTKTTASPQHQQPHINAALFQQQQQQQQQNRAIVPPKAPPFDGFSNLSAFDKQRMLQHLQDKQKHFEAAHIAPPSHVVGTGVLGAGVISKQQQQQQAATLLQQHQTQALQSSNASHHHLHHTQQQQQQPQQQSPSQPPPVSQQQQQHTQPPTIVGPLIPAMMNQPQPQQQQQQQQQHQQQLAMQAHLSQPPLQTVNMDTGHKLSDYMRGAIDPHECVSTASSELLALHNGAWSQDRGDGVAISQDKIIRAFSELMRNIAKMKTFIRPSMCKPYGKQSESLQKTLFDTIQLLQMLRNCLPAPHIPVSSWKGSEVSGGTETALN
ncbi:uncharacterized protein LOC128709720 [Anopheles marshallii]|uniref:uncharacterized protein LOC128709720 n=1 Tax=Anopheles marshallii TaxID=1521116 RepID=UPI00237BDB5B|nr:uncharacterized protein LOC128709720 [Anopheles marshallii]